jgi:hypothetical protein
MVKNKLATTLSVLFSVSIFFISCKKNDIPGTKPSPNPVAKKLWKIKTNDNDSTLFAYTTTGELHKVIKTEEGSGDDVVTYTFIYTPTSIVSEIATSMGEKHKFVYEGNRLKLIENYVGPNKASEYFFEYSDNRLSTTFVRTPSRANNGGPLYNPTFKITYSYDASGELKKVASYAINPNTNAQTKVNEKEINQYDNNKNPLGILSPLTLARAFEFAGEHNITRQTLYNRLGQIEETTMNSYVYDDDKYPVTSTSTLTPNIGSPTTTNFKYYYK